MRVPLLLSRRLKRVELLLSGKSLHVLYFTTSSASALNCPQDRPILVRDFIHNALYDPHGGYFSAKSEAVGVLPYPIEFGLLKGRMHYMQHLHELYKQNGISWFTPVELFKPWFGYSLAKYMLKGHNPKFPLQVFEIGGGTGTCARNILDYVKSEAPSVYENTQYVSVEISKALANAQLKSVHAEKSHKAHFTVECRDACNRSKWGKADHRPCFVIMVEVLDNQPHDLIYKKNSSCAWMETCITKGPDGTNFVEVHQPVEDPLIWRFINIMDDKARPHAQSWWLAVKNLVHKAIPFERKAWIPTATLQLLEALYLARPNMALIICDFSVLPDVQVQGERAPLVSCKKDGITVDLSSYLDVKGDADIFFPTDFDLLRKLDNHCFSTMRSADLKSKHRKHFHSHIVSFDEFMRQYADTSKTKTKSGFNPLLDDYSNMQFYITRWM